jgi:uncharacterized protein
MPSSPLIGMNPISQPRINYLDFLRALALLGIVLVHSHDHFNLYVYPEDLAGFWGKLNSIAHWIYSEFFVSKSFLIFSFLFGVSFFLQLDRANQRGEDMRLRFLWRLALLFVIGFAHSLFYDGDILTIFAVLGVILVPLYRLKPTLLFILALLILGRLPLVADCIVSLINPSWVSAPQHFYWSFVKLPPREVVYASPSIADVFEWNLLRGHTDKWSFFIESGRIWQTLGLFVLGLWAGKKRLFEKMNQHRKAQILITLLASCVWIVLTWGRPYLVDLFPSSATDSIRGLCIAWSNLAFATAFVALTAYISTWSWSATFINFFAAIGRATLTCYVSQTLIMTYLFFGWGCGLASQWNYAQSMAAGALLFLVQAIGFNIWFRFFRYGPLEWIWRSGTRCRWEPFLCTPPKTKA